MKMSETSFFSNFHYTLIILILCLNIYSCDYKLYKVNGSYPKVKKLPSEEYLVILNNGIYIFNNNFSNSTEIKKFEEEQIVTSDEDNIKTTISEFKDNSNFYVFCLIKNYLYLFNYNTSNIAQFNLNEYIKGGMYYNLNPYKCTNDSLEYIISYINISYLTLDEINKNFKI